MTNNYLQQFKAPNDDAEQAPLTAYSQLKPIERAFVDAYIADMEASAIKAGRTIAEYVLIRNMDDEPKLVREAERKRAKWFAEEPITKPLVRAAISERVNELTRVMEISAHNVLKEVANIAKSSIGDLMEIGPDGMPYWTLNKASPEKLATIQSFEVEYDGQGMPKKMKIKLHDKLAALDKLMRHFGLLDGTAASAGSTLQSSSSPGKQIAAHTSTAQAADMYASMLGKG